MSVTPAVSVCIPAHNGAAFLAETITSVLRQEFADFELVIADDSSHDATPDIVASFADPRIRYLRRDTGLGLADNWRYAVQACRAPLVKLLCQDDLLYPQCLAGQVAVMHQDTGARVALVCGTRDIIDCDGKRLFCQRGCRGPDRRVPAAEAIRRVVRRGANVFGEPLVGLFRKEVYLRAGGYRDHLPYCIDLDLWCRLLQHGDLYQMDSAVGAFRVSQHSLSWTLRGRQAAQDRAFFASLQENGVTPIRSWEVLLGQARCTMDSILRQAYYAYLRTRRRG